MCEETSELSDSLLGRHCLVSHAWNPGRVDMLGLMMNGTLDQGSIPYIICSKNK